MASNREIFYLAQGWKSVESLEEEAAVISSELVEEGRSEDLTNLQHEKEDDVWVTYSETLYFVAGNPQFTPRKTEPQDISDLKGFVTEETEIVFGSTDAGVVYEKSCFSLVLVDPIFGKLVAHASFDDNPMDSMINIYEKRWATEPELEGVMSLNSLFLRIFLHNQKYGPDACLAELIVNTFLACTGISNLIIECPTLDYEGPYLFTSLARSVIFSPNPKTRKKLIIYVKDKLLPHLNVREGREHDFHDLVPQMQDNEKEIEESFGGRPLADLVALSDRNNQSLVAEYADRAVGIAIVTTDINYKFLHRHFHLEAFHGLFRPHKDDLADVIHIEARKSTLLEPVQSDEGKFSKDRFFETPIDGRSRVFRPEKASEMGLVQQPSETRAEEHTENTSGQSGDDTTALVKAASSKTANSQALSTVVSNPKQSGVSLKSTVGLRLDEPTPELLHDQFIEQVALIDGMVLPLDAWNESPTSRYVGLPNAIAIQLLTMDKRFHARFEDLIHDTFLKFPNRDYAIVTIPSHSPEPYWTKYFSAAVKRKDSVYSKSLYVLHRDAFSSSVTIRIANEPDLGNIGTFLSTIIGGEKILEDVEHSLSVDWKAHTEENELRFTITNSGHLRPMLTFIMTAQNYYDNTLVIVGFAMISNEPEPTFYHVNYNLDNYTYANDLQPADYGYVHHFLLSPLFQIYSRLFMKEILRRTKKHFAFHKLLPFFEAKKDWAHQSVLNNIEDWIPLGPRKRINYEHLNLKDIYDEDRQPSPSVQDYRNPSGVVYFSKKFLFDTKPKVGARIVFIGASDTTIAAVEKLVFGGSLLAFKHLTIISTNGLPGSLGPDTTRNLFLPRNGSPSLSMESDDEWQHRLGLRNQVNVVYGTVTKLMRNKKMVQVNGKEVVRYDLLIIGAGRQFIRPDCPVAEIQDEHFDRYHKSISVQIASDYLENRVVEPSKPLKRLSVKPHNVFLINMDLDAAIALNFLREYLPLNSHGHIIVHGACLEAYCCINALLRLNVDVRRIVLVVTPEEVMEWEKLSGYVDTPKLKEVVTNSFKHLGVRVIKSYMFRKWEVEFSSNLATRIFFSSPMAKDETTNISISCLAYFPFVVRRVSDEIATVCTECFLGYNNGILIDTAFQTMDEHIWAAGPCTTYSKALCADKYFHGFYSSYEIGKLVADLIIKKFDPTSDTRIVNRVNPGQSLLPPLLTAPILRYAELPGGWFYLHLRRPGLQEKCCHGEHNCTECGSGTEVVTGSIDDKNVESTRKYFRILLNSFLRVEGLECISQIEFSPSNLASLYGHHEAFLNKLLQKVEKGEAEDLYNFFEQAWVGAICHGRWPDFREELQDLYADYDIGANFKIYNFIRDYLDHLDNPKSFKVDPNILRHIFENSGMKAIVELKFLEFLKYNRAAIPMFARPDYVEEMSEERETSVVYFPRVPNF